MALPPTSPDARSQQIAAQNQVFLREVDDAVRQDQMMGAMKRWGIPLLVAIVLGLAGLGGWLWWRADQASKLGQQGEQFAQALDQVQGGQLDAARGALVPLAAKPGTGLGADAAVMAAAIAEAQNKDADAAKQFAALAANADAPQALRDLAAIRGVAANFDALPPQQAVDRLKPFAVPGNVWFGNAGELLGMAYIKLGKRDLAGALFASIARDEKVNASLRGRARQFAGLLGVDSMDDIAKPLSDANSGANAAAPQ